MRVDIVVVAGGADVGAAAIGMRDNVTQAGGCVKTEDGHSERASNEKGQESLGPPALPGKQIVDLRTRLVKSALCVTP